MRVLIVEDEPAILAGLAETLRAQDYVVDEAADGIEGLYKATEFPIDLAIVDLGLPEKDGMSLIQEMREKGCSYPVLILTARDHWQDKVDGLDAGADDYVVKPFHPDEVLARVNALLRRSGGWADKALSFGPIEVDTRSQSVQLNGAGIELTAFEYKLLEYLMMNSGKVLSKGQLAEAIYAEDTDPDSNVIEVLIGRLRKKLDPDQSVQPIETLRGRGYKFRRIIPSRASEGTKGEGQKNRK